MTKEDNEKGFSLIELLIVMVILGLLAGLVGPRFFRQGDKAQQKAVKSQIALFEAALDSYRLDVGRYPTTQQGLEALRKAPDGVSKWDGPYLPKEVPTDSWDNQYLYRQPGEHGDYDIISFGADGAAGGTDMDQDIVNWKGLDDAS